MARTSPLGPGFRRSFQSFLEGRPITTSRGVVLPDSRPTQFGYPGGSHQPNSCCVYRRKSSNTDLLLDFYSNFSTDDLITKVVQAGKTPHKGAGASVQFNMFQCLSKSKDGEICLGHKGVITVKTAISRPALVSLLKEICPSALEHFCIGGDKPGSWPVVLGSTADLPSLLDNLFVYSYAIEQIKRQIRGEVPLPAVVFDSPGMRPRAPDAGAGG